MHGNQHRMHALLSRKRTILQHIVYMRDVDELLAHIQSIIDTILTDRKKSGITPEGFQQLLERLRGTPETAAKLEMIKAAVSVNTFSSDQGKEVLEELPTAFDKVGGGNMLTTRTCCQQA